MARGFPNHVFPWTRRITYIEACNISITFHFETGTASLQRTIINHNLCIFSVHYSLFSIQDGATVLTVASENGFTLIVEALCKAGANVDHSNAVS